MKKADPMPLEEGGAAFPHGAECQTNHTATAILFRLREDIKSRLLSGQTVSLIHFPERERAAAMGAIASLRDELPVRRHWYTVRESHLSETRLRALRYSIPGEFLRGEVTP
jgi:hypothetical protein